MNWCGVKNSKLISLLCPCAQYILLWHSATHVHTHIYGLTWWFSDGAGPRNGHPGDIRNNDVAIESGLHTFRHGTREYNWKRKGWRHSNQISIRGRRVLGAPPRALKCVRIKRQRTWRRLSVTPPTSRCLWCGAPGSLARECSFGEWTRNYYMHYWNIPPRPKEQTKY